jgi:putative membrane protein
MKKLIVATFAVVLLAFFAIGAAQQNTSSETVPTDKAFISKVAQINLAEVELGKLAEQKGNPAVKDFGTRMIQDHMQAENDLQQLAEQENVTLPTEPGSEASSIKQQLSEASGAQFNQSYLEHMLSGHKSAIALLENEIEHGQNPAIKAYAEKVLPVVQDHVRIAEDVAGKMGMSGKQGLQEAGKAVTTSPK